MKFLKIKLLIVAIIMFAASSAFASYSYNIDVNTSSMIGQTGYIDLQMNADDTAGIAYATTSNFTSDAAFIGSPALTGSASGLLSNNTVAIDTSGTKQMNDYFHQMTFGNYIHFQLTLAGAANNTFSLSFYNSDVSAALFSTDPLGTGAAAQINLNANNTASILTTSNETTVTPIPAAFWLLGSGLAGLVGIRRRS